MHIYTCVHFVMNIILYLGIYIAKRGQQYES